MNTKTMEVDKTKNLEYVFWLNGWADRSVFGGRLGHFKCLITRDKISIKPIENDPDKELNIEISSIQKCKIGYEVKEPNRYVDLFLSDRKIVLCPINPFEPKPILLVNHNEASAMINLINAFRSNVEPEIDTNPYLRQLATKDNLKRFKSLNIEWDKHTSPWNYYDLYGNKFLWPKVISLIIVLAIVVTPIILGVVYLLDALNII